MKPKRMLPVCLCSLIASACLMLGGMVLYFIWPLLFRHIMESNFVLTPESRPYDLWKKFPIPLSIDFYFFNWTNPEQVYNSSAKPIFKEIGPYRFSETKEKTNIIWNENGTVSFKHKKYWFHTNEGRSLSDPITTINPVAVVCNF